MVSYTDDNYGGTTKCKCKPRKVSSKRDFPDAFDHKLAKKQKVCEDDGFIPLESDSDSDSESVSSDSCGSVTGGLDHGIIPRINLNDKEEEYEVESKIDGKTESVTNERVKRYEQVLSKRKMVYAVRSFPPGCGPNAALLSDEDLKVARESVEAVRSKRKLMVNAVRSFPPGCGPNAALLSDEDLKVVRESVEAVRSRRKMVYAVRSFPPGCGPNARILSDEHLKVAKESVERIK